MGCGNHGFDGDQSTGAVLTATGSATRSFDDLIFRLRRAAAFAPLMFMA
ncbi:MAG: hypothetical protein ACI841_005004 [Planctomycetota bacterium]|jgi:hypothetical protein